MADAATRPSPYTGRNSLPWFDAARYGVKASNTAAQNATALAAALAAMVASGLGGVLRLPGGVIQYNATLVPPLKMPLIIVGQGVPHQAAGVSTGTELRYTARDGTKAVNCEMASTDFSLFRMEDLYLSGGTYAEVVGGPGQGGAALGNGIGLSIKNRLRWELRNVRIAGFDSDGLRIDVNSYYGAAYTSRFLFNGGAGVNSIDGGNVEGFFNCHFEYNVYGSKNLRSTFNCAWEGNYKSGAVHNVLAMLAAHYKPYFEANNGSNTAGEADVYSDVTNYANGIALYDPYFASPATYSARVNATYGFTGKATSLHIYGVVQAIVASPQNFAVFNLVGATAMYWYGSQSPSFANFVAIAAGAQFFNRGPGYLDVQLTGGTTLTHYNNPHIRLTATGAQNLDNIQSGGFYGMKLTLRMADTNVTVRHIAGGTGNIRLRTGTYLAGINTAVLVLVYEPNGDIWCEESRSG